VDPRADDVDVVSLTAENIHDVLAVSALPDQSTHVRSVAWYVARSAYEQVWTPVAFRLGDEVVGFGEWAFDADDATYCIGGFIIDGKRQGQGLGRRCLTALIANLRQRRDCGPIALSVDNDNDAARGLYAALGFRESGEVLDDGELVMVLERR
jgi:diamine N-acetyltransferase